MAETGRKKRLPELGRRGFITKARETKEGSPLKQSPGGSPKRPSSPEPNCSICLGGIEDQSFANKCFHSFCKTCLFEWSKVKPECPVCRQGFDSIIHSVKAMDDYEEFAIPRPLSPRSLFSVGVFTESGQHSWGQHRHGDLNNLNILRHRVIHFQDVFSSRRNTIHGSARRLSLIYQRINDNNSSSTSSTNATINSSNSERTPPRAHESSRNTTFPFDLHAWLRNRIGFETAAGRVTPVAGTSDHRRYIYDHDLWVQPITGRLSRECSASFYRDNPAVTHRLLPFLNRELCAILRTGSDTSHSTEALLSRIKSAIFEYDIPSIRFRQVIEPFTRDKTHHFLHELYYFAKSPYTIEDYNVHAIYGPKSSVKQLKLEQPAYRPFFTAERQEPETDSSTDDSVIEVVDSDQEQSSRKNKNRVHYIPSSSSSSSSPVTQTTCNPLGLPRTIELASPDERETRKAIRQVQKLTKEMGSHANQETPTLSSTLSQSINVIEDFDNPRPGPSGLCRISDVKSYPIDDDGSDTEIDVGTNEKPPVRKLNFNDSDSDDSDDSIKVVGFKKPVHERTPEIINISSCGESADGKDKSDDDSSDDDERPLKKRFKRSNFSLLDKKRTKMTRKRLNKNEPENEDDKITDSEGSENDRENKSKKRHRKRRKPKSSHSRDDSIKRRKDTLFSHHMNTFHEPDLPSTPTESSSEDDTSSSKWRNSDCPFSRRIPSVIVRPLKPRDRFQFSSSSSIDLSSSLMNCSTRGNISSISGSSSIGNSSILTTSSASSTNDISNNNATPNTNNDNNNSNNNNVIATLCSSLKRRFDESTDDTEATDDDIGRRRLDVVLNHISHMHN